MLTFKMLRQANVLRCGESFHPLDAWTPSDWAMAMAGECGEVCNQVKKLRRLQDGFQLANIPPSASQIVIEIEKELGDLLAYADLLAARLGINLGHAVARKFNDVSIRVGSAILLPVGE